MLKDPPVEGTWTVETPFANVLVRGNRRGVTGIKFLSTNHAPREVEDQPPTDLWPWVEPLLGKLEEYFVGHEVDFADVPVDLSEQPEFRRKVQLACRKIGYGQTVTYAELARRAGQPSAGRAVGSAMSHNPVPIVIPCHRVVRSDGGLGGFSAPEGISLKKRLLEMERGSE
jgi:methylated-DNA-[protein]-cysteine S-methyltransferase